MPGPKFRKAAGPQAQGGSFEDRLSAMQSRWKEAPTLAKNLFERIPEGDYIGKLVSCQMADSSTSGKMLIKRCHTPTEGELKGKNAYDSLSVETDNGFAWVVKWLDSIGAEIPGDAKDLAALIKEINKVGYNCKFSVRHPKDFDGVNVTVEEVIDGDGGTVAAPPAEGGDGGEVDLETMNRKELEALVKKYQMSVKTGPKVSDKDLRLAIIAANADGDGAPDDELSTRARTFCEGAGIELEESDDAEAIAKKIKDGFTFEEDKLDEDEKKILNDLGIYDDVVEKPKAKAPLKLGKAKPKFGK